LPPSSPYRWRFLGGASLSAVAGAAWQTIGRADTFAAWKLIGAALVVGKAHGPARHWRERGMGPALFSRIRKWIKANGFDRMPKSTRSVAIELFENATAIEAWRATLPEKQRRRLVCPLSNVRRWRAATQSNGKAPADLKREAMAAWRKFMSCVRALPADQALAWWNTVFDEATARR
jgi:hypothetical protein